MSDHAEFLEMERGQRREYGRRMKLVKEEMARFAGCSFEAILWGFIEEGHFHREDVVRAAKRAQLDIDEVAVRARMVVVQRQLMAALRASEAGGGPSLASLRRTNRAWRRYRVLSKEQEALEAEQERIWKAREEMFTHRAGVEAA